MERKPGENSAASSPLSRVHRWQIIEPKDVTSAGSDDESPSETNVKLHISSYNDDQERNVHYNDGTKQEEIVPAGSQVVGLQEEFGSSPYQKLAQADSKDVDAIQHTDGDDMAFSEFSQLRLQMKCLMQIQTKTTSEEEVDLSDLYSSNINTNPSPESHPVAGLNDYTDIGDSGRSLQDRNHPYGGKGKSHFERKLKHRIHKRNILESQTNRTSSDRSCSLSEDSNTDSNIIVIPETPWYPHEVTVNVKAADVAFQDEPLTPREASPSLRPVQLVAETAPPRETILSPMYTPQIVLEQGPTVKYIAKPVSVVVKVDAQSQSGTMKTPTSLSSESSPLQPPPSYSECIRHMASPSGREIIQQLPRVSRKTLHPPRKPESLLPLCRTNPNLYAAPVAGYSQFHNTGPNLLDTNISIYTGNKPDVQVSQEGARTTFMDNEHQFLAFISCLFCWPIGLVAIYYSNMCQILKAEGNHAQAQVYGRQAFIVSTLAMCAGSLTYIIMLIYQKVW